MAFRIKVEESVAEGIKRMARGQIERTLAGLTGQNGATQEEVVHDARKRFKKVRALLRLARGGLGRKLVARENARFRDAARPLSEVRDAGVLVDAFDQLIKRCRGRDHPEAIEAVRLALLDHKRQVSRHVLEEEQVIERVTAVAEEARSDVKRWDVDEDDWTALEGGLKRTYRLGYEAFRVALDDPDDENLHELRKRVKDLWYTFNILEPIRPDFTREQGEHAERLADDLGDDHDLAVLKQFLSDPALPLRDRSALEAILPLIDRRRAELQQEAFDLGWKLYSEKPRAFVKRMGAYWNAWRSEVNAAQL